MHTAEAFMKDYPYKAFHIGLKLQFCVHFIEEHSIFEPGGKATFVSFADRVNMCGKPVAHCGKYRQQIPICVLNREKTLVHLHRGDDYLFRKA